MRLRGIEISGFRAFAGTAEFDLDADAIVVVGANGQGKTSFFDGILWALTGTIPRLGESAETAVSMYAESGEARVELRLQGHDHGCRVVRTSDGETQRLLFDDGARELRGSAAEARLLEVIWPEALATPDPKEALTGAVTRSAYLQQDLVRDFVEAVDAKDRFTAVSELVGVGRLTDLQVELDKAKRAWSRATTVVARDRDEVAERVNQLKGLVQRLRESESLVPGDLEESWEAWWRGAQAGGVQIEQVPGISDGEASSALDLAMGQVDVLLRQAKRREDEAGALQTELARDAETAMPDIAPLRTAVEEAEAQAVEAKSALENARSEAAREREKLIAAQEAREDMRALAELALRHMSERCPVCEQAYDRAATEERLRSLIEGEPETGSPSVTTERIEELSVKLSECEGTLENRRDALRTAQAEAERAELRRAALGRRLEDLGVVAGADAILATAVAERARQLASAVERLQGIRREGERLALVVAQVRQRARRAEAEAELQRQASRLAELDGEVREREETGELAGTILGALRDQGTEFVKAELERIEPTLQRIYTRIDPHPALKVVRLLASISYGRGRLDTQLVDQELGVSTEAPRAVLSSSQTNALAVAIFLALNLAVPRLPLEAALLDDPLQSLDDVNLLGLIDLLRRTRDVRQLVVSTHDARFGRLLERKLRPVGDSRGTIVFEFAGWGRSGPVVVPHRLEPDRAPLRVVSA